MDKVAVSTSRWTWMDQLFRYAMGILVGSALIVVSQDRFAKLWSPTPDLQYVVVLLQTILLILVIVLVFRWLVSVSGEMRLLRDHFPERIGPQPGQVIVWTILFSILLGALGSFTGNIVAFGCIFAVYSLGDIWRQRLRNTQLLQAFRDTAGEVPAEPVVQSKRQAIERYYLERPQIERSATVMFFSFTALTLALFAKANPSQAVTEALHAFAYAIIIADIVISEIVIWRWRKARDAELGETYSF